MARRNKRNWKRQKYAEDQSLLHSYRNASVDESTQSDLADLFDKKFTYDGKEEWPLPDSGCLFTSDRWEDAELLAIREKLNDTKNLLSELDIEKWHKHTQNTHRAGLVGGLLRNVFKPELCTQAWCKFHEIVGSYDIIKPLMGTFSSVHICEAPGAFITSLNHRIKSSGLHSRSIQWNWLGNTLNPYYEGNSLSSMIDDDRFIFDTLDHWCFGDDNTGDIMSKDNIEDLIQKAADIQPVLLVTADGSIDCANNPAEQEQLVSHLHYCEFVCAVSVLAPGGSFVLKMFTMLEDCSVSLMYLLNVLFRKVNVIKPVTSKPGNSEVYVVACDFKGISDEWKRTLNKFIGNDNTRTCMLPKESIPPSFVDAHRTCCDKFCTWQIQTIQENIRLYQSPEADLQWLDSAKKYCACEYIDRFRLKQIPQEDKVTMMFDKFDKKRKCNNKPRPCARKRHAGSYADRAQLSSLPWKQRVAKMKTYPLPSSEPVTWLRRGDLMAEEVKEWEMTTGKPVENVLTSRFCDSDLLTQYNDLLTHVETVATISTASANDYTAAFDEIIQLMCQNECSEDKIIHVTTATDRNRLQSSFVEHCQSKKIEMICISPDSREVGNDVCVFIEAVSDKRKEDSLHCLRELASALKRMVECDNLLLEMQTPLTRMFASVLYLLHTLFKQVAVFHDHCGKDDSVIIVCGNYLGNVSLLQDYLDAVCSTTLAGESVVLSFIPITLLHDFNFINHVQQRNDAFLQKRINNMIKLEIERL